MISQNARILLVVHHDLFRECLISGMNSRFSSLATEAACSTMEGLEAADSGRFDLVLFDADSPEPITPDQIREYKLEHDSTHLVVVGRKRDEKEIIAFLEAGASDFRIADSETLDEFCESLEKTLKGGFVLTPDRTRALFARLQSLSAEVSRMQNVDTGALTDREMQILKLVDKGQSNKDIAKQLHLSLHTVKNHVHRIIEKLQVTNRREAVHLAYSHGWLKVGAN